MAYIPVKFKNHCSNPSCYIQKTPKNIEKMAEGLIKYLFDNDLFGDARVYYKKKNTWYACQPDLPYEIKYHKENKYGDTWTEVNKKMGNKDYHYYQAEIDPNRCFEYNGDYLSMSFEGELYNALNYSWSSEYSYLSHVEEQLNNYFSHWGLYLEMGYAWSFSLYE